MIYVRYINERYSRVSKHMPVLDDDITLFEDGLLNSSVATVYLE
jgi:hypothetical protein